MFLIVASGEHTEQFGLGGGFLTFMKEQFRESYIISRSCMTLPMPVATFITSTACRIPTTPGTIPRTPLSLQLLHPSDVTGFGYRHR
jgi:hypothetical protein